MLIMFSVDQIKRVFCSQCPFYNSCVLRQSTGESDTTGILVAAQIIELTFANLFHVCHKLVG